MHDTVYKARMTEETFQILLDVMEKHFAALSLPDPADNPKISRAISFSELPTTRTIRFEQCYQADNNTLVKQYSCEQIFDKCSNTLKVSETVKTGSEHSLTSSWTTPQPIFKIPGKRTWSIPKFGQFVRPQQPDEPQKIETMEIEEIDVKPTIKVEKDFSKKLPIMELNGMTISDSSCNDRALIKASTFTNAKTAKNSGLSKPLIRSRSASPKKFPNASLSNEITPLTNNNLINVQNVLNTDNVQGSNDSSAMKRKLRSLIPVESKDLKISPISTCYKIMFFLLLSISVMIFAMLIAEEKTSREGYNGFNSTSVIAELRDRVRGQDRAIGELTRELEKYSKGINLVVLVGGTGVGKSYSVGIIAKSFDYVFEYFSPLQEKIHEVFTEFSTRQCNFVILENQKYSDLPEIAKFVNFMKDHTKELCVFTAAVFNPRETGSEPLHKSELDKSIGKISTFFRERSLRSTKIIVFDELDEKTLDSCIKEAANRKNVILSRDQFLEIRENLISIGSGCKGAYAKVQLLIEA